MPPNSAWNGGRGDGPKVAFCLPWSPDRKSAPMYSQLRQKESPPEQMGGLINWVQGLDLNQ
ncbi:MAG: hypothetical protein ABII82_20600, partial [Verrucomicrobiota bacterium]